MPVRDAEPTTRAERLAWRIAVIQYRRVSIIAHQRHCKVYNAEWSFTRIRVVAHANTSARVAVRRKSRRAPSRWMKKAVACSSGNDVNV